MSKAINYTSINDGVELRRADTVDSLASNWHMEGWLPEGELVILGGDGGEGKTLIAMDWIATVSNGGTDRGIFSDGTEAQRGSSLIWSCEDDWNRALKPRLEAAGANCRNIFFVGGFGEFNSRRSFDFKTDLPGLISEIEELGDVKILVIDTIMEAVSGGGNNAKMVRQDLLKLVDIAHKYQITIIGIAHLIKDSKKGDPVKNLAGSQAFSNLARHVLIAMKVRLPDGGEGGPSVGVLTRAKSNVGKSGGGRIYEIHPMTMDAVDDGRAIETARLIWYKRELSGSALDLRRWAESEKDEMANSPRNRAQEFLLQILRNGPLPVKDVYAFAEEDGITEKMVRSASEKLGVTKTRRGGGERGSWSEWELPERSWSREPLINFDLMDEEHEGQVGQVGQVYERGGAEYGSRIYQRLHAQRRIQLIARLLCAATYKPM